MAVQPRRLYKRLAWTNAQWRGGGIGQENSGSRVHQAVVQQGQLDLEQVQADAHSGERAENGRLDGLSDDGLDALVAGRGGEPDT